MIKDALGDRMKSYYEDRSRYSILRKSYTVIRVDGKAFHTYTKKLHRPFDIGLMADMDSTAGYLCKNIQGAKFAYVQSDEISILITDFEDIKTDMWFDGNLQKMSSVAASMATAEFNKLRLIRMVKNEIELADEHIKESHIEKFKMAEFDARVFQLPNATEVKNYFIWRQQDATRNSISSVAQSMWSHKELHGKSSDEKQEMIFQKSGKNWNDYTSREKRGGFIEKVISYIVPPLTTEYVTRNVLGLPEKSVNRSKWTSVECPIFTQNTEFLSSRIPLH